MAESDSEKNGVLSIEEVLAEEADAIEGHGSIFRDSLDPIIRGTKAQEKRFQLNADERNGDESENLRDTTEARKKLYRQLNELNRGALCFSGGGIRSATFCLGILQALARCDHIQPLPKHDEHHSDQRNRTHQPDERKGQKDETITLTKSLLGSFHYLSTVSGGGYIGSWLSAWRRRASFADIVSNLTGRPNGADFEPPQISWLRAYSNYLTPQLGIGSADSWAAVAIIVRNLVLNWLVIIPVVALGVLALKFIATISAWTAHDVLNPCAMIAVALAGAILLIAAQAFTTYHRPALLRPSPPAGQATAPRRIKCWLCRHTVGHEKPFFCRRINVNDTCFVWGDLVWAAFSAIFLTVFFTSNYFWNLLDSVSAELAGGGTLPELVKSLALTPKFEIPALTAIAGIIIYAIGWIVGWPQTFRGRDWFRWALSGMIYGALVGFGAYLFSLLTPYPPSGRPLPLLVAIIFGVPWIIMSQLAADNIFGGLVSYEPHSDSDREWLGRAAGWLAAFAIAWVIVAGLVFAGEYAVQLLLKAGRNYVIASGGVMSVISGLVTALLGSSAKTPAKSSGTKQNDYVAWAYDIALAIAGPIFVALLIVALSIALDRMLFGGSLINLLQGGPPALQANAPAPQCGPLPLKDVSLCLQGGTLSLQDGTLSLQGGTLSMRAAVPAQQIVSNPPAFEPPSKLSIAGWFAAGFLILGLIAWISSRCVNINRFSIHALYRNRLIRAYLGASRDRRHPNRFTGFDSADNVRMHELWTSDINPPRLFHVVNISLNVVSTKRLAWQERKAEPFIVTPKHSGGAYVGFRSSDVYGDSIHTHHGQGIALGTAMAISGAAVSSNMGYNSSPSLSLLLTLFNVRLGWWLGNPGPAGEKNRAYGREGPKWAAGPLFAEALGRTTDRSPYVYLSDGGHFENLGFYEMVRRRCRLIIVVDAGCDPKYTFEDLGNAVRKIWIDLGIRVTFDTLADLVNRPTSKQLSSLAALETGPNKKISQDEARKKIPYHAVGTVHYADADGEGCQDGKVIYIKPAYHGTEGAAVRSYATANPTFPHETTADQWFTESQFESYRALGLDIGDAVLAAPDVRSALRDFL